MSEHDDVGLHPFGFETSGEKQGFKKSPYTGLHQVFEGSGINPAVEIVLEGLAAGQVYENTRHTRLSLYRTHSQILSASNESEQHSRA